MTFSIHLYLEYLYFVVTNIENVNFPNFNAKNKILININLNRYSRKKSNDLF